MSADGTKLLFEGFLQKRKDTLKIMWVTYWFRLQNTTLFFYTKKNGSALHLRGYYYIYTVQSVREVQKADRQRFMFEIIMTSGKRKVLAAETAALRKEWVGHLWRAMNLSTSSGVSQLQMCEQQPDRRHSSRTPVSVMELLPARPLSAPPPSDHLQPEARSIKPAVDQPEEQSGEEEAIYQNTLLSACSYQDHSDDPQRCSELNDAESSLEGDYDVLPVRNKICEASISAEMDENIYDFPQSYRTSAQRQDLTESIYDVPSSLLRKMPEDKTDEQLEEESSWKVAFEDSSSTFSSQCI